MKHSLRRPATPHGHQLQALSQLAAAAGTAHTQARPAPWAHVCRSQHQTVCVAGAQHPRGSSTCTCPADRGRHLLTARVHTISAAAGTPPGVRLTRLTAAGSDQARPVPVRRQRGCSKSPPGCLHTLWTVSCVPCSSLRLVSPCPALQGLASSANSHSAAPATGVKRLPEEILADRPDEAARDAAWHLALSQGLEMPIYGVLKHVAVCARPSSAQRRQHDQLLLLRRPHCASLQALA